MLYGGWSRTAACSPRRGALGGRRVAGVAALTAEIAEQAVALIEVEYEVLPSLTDYVAAMEPGAPLVHDGWEGYEARRRPRPQRQRARPLHDRQGRRGRRDGGRRRRGQEPLLGRRLAGRPDRAARRWSPSGRATRSPSGPRPRCRSRPAPGWRTPCSIPRASVRIIVPLLGGGFGSKCDFHFEAHVAALAQAARRPVRLVFSRHEEFIAPDHRREGMVIELETGARRDGTPGRPARSAGARQAAPTAARAASSPRWPRCTPAART